jgi:PIN domain nuclease of toxin-antitoxin system
MNILLDTHALIWYLEGSGEISENARKAIENVNNTCFVSIASIWEIAIKLSIDKLKMNISFDRLSSLIWENGFEILQIRIEHTKELISLPFTHKAPFDRLLISQAKTETMSVVTKDIHFRNYNIPLIW